MEEDNEYNFRRSVFVAVEQLIAIIGKDCNNINERAFIVETLRNGFWDVVTKDYNQSKLDLTTKNQHNTDSNENHK